jgi:tyrosine-specific transport protein
VGAGILALPFETSAAGFSAAAPALVGAWSYSVATGLLLAEVTLAAGVAEEDAPPASLLSLARRSLGDAGANAAGAAYLLLHYGLLVAYEDKAADVLSRSVPGLSEPAAAAAFTAALGALCAFASPAALDAANGAMLAALVAVFGALLLAAAPGVRLEALAQANWGAIPPALPVIALAFVYHNVVPRVCASCGGHAPSVRTAIVAGTALPLVMFVAWEGVALGGAPAGGATSADPLQYLAAPPAAVDAFSLLAVATSYVGFVLGLSDFFADALAQTDTSASLSPAARKTAPLLLTLLPPLAAAVTYPDAFFAALEFAAIYGVMSLFGVLPGAMALSERARAAASGMLPPPMIVPGGDAAAAALSVAAGCLIAASAAGVLERPS